MTSHSLKTIAPNSSGRSASADSASSAEVPRDIAEAFSDRFRIVEMLGRTNEAACYLAEVLNGPDEDGASGLVRLKVLSDAAARDPELLNLFRLEAEAASSLSHPNILNTESVEQMGLYHFCAIEHSAGATTLRSLLDRKGWLDAPRASGIAMQVARALEEAHKDGVLHLKLSPESVLLMPDGIVRLADFGIGAGSDLKWAQDRRSNLCLARYASPEQSSGDPVDHRSDLYSLGVILFEALTDRVPFNGENSERIRLKHRTQSPLSPDVYCESVPRALSSVVMRLLEKNPRDRFENASELQAALAEFAPAAPSPARAPVVSSEAVSSEAPGRAVLLNSFNTFDMDFDIEPLGDLLPEPGLQKNESESDGARQFEEIEPARERLELSEEEADAGAPVEQPENITIHTAAHPEAEQHEPREPRLAANSQRIAEKIKAASIIEIPIEAPVPAPVPVKLKPSLQPSIQSQAIDLPAHRDNARPAIVHESSARKYQSQPEPSDSTGRRRLGWLALVAVVALCLAAVTFADRFPKLLFGGAADIPNEQGREAGTFVPTPAQAMPESASPRKDNGGEAGSASSAKPDAESSAAPPIKNAAPSAKPPASANKSGRVAKPVARKSKARLRKSSARQRTSRKVKLPAYNPRYN